ncbi:penicillin-binding protein 1C [Gluconobacter kanchanaburiensis]|uniref:peptidoglycan glycosyltransferase n=1 Tax=Gluconobacter kanchanaburiensis NBRC 103587 TaxID=1307948 RepID=A0A511B459_9PROT|nr:penicillin-binding protein 1C [Gluconobacter kanchanaburiensis]MBF0861585.1 penicillin-binding protein 1C [Gluconobacter kanchanaburiensis]GBR67025.1 penicillin-binding protein PbpC [Gluconobacter kanchanaburiensis NBRC 103587]GEK95226.1 penicillin-binding protein 1C [Gluconobacter kanchanaburiensis NBRC 103587]
MTADEHPAEKAESRPARASLRAARLACLLAAIVIGALFVIDRLSPPDLHRAQQAALLVQARDHTLLDGHTASDGLWRLPVQASHVDPAYLQLLMTTEDRRFDDYPGVDPEALARASWQLARRGHIVSGGSTLAMQTARLLAPHPHTWSGKLRDILRALQLEWHFGRSGVLDLYLTLAPEGGNIEGIRTASLLYFGHEPDHLTSAEAAILVTLPRRPAAFRPDMHPDALKAAALRTLRRASLAVPADTWPSNAWSAPTSHGVPHEAPELTGHFLSAGRGGVVLTTLDASLQRSVRHVLASQAAPLRGTFAALVADHERRIIAWVGGAEHMAPGNAIDAVLTARSPGSALKPFVYGMAFEKGWMTPRTRLNDSRLAIGGYAPLDFDHTFRGETTVSEALQLSLNVPAIQALNLVGPTRFMERLSNSGARLHLPKNPDGTQNAPSLAIVLGGVGISLHDLTMLYAALDHDGRVAPLRIELTEPGTENAASGTQLLSVRANADIRTILRGTAPPAGVASWDRVAFKTGTSYGNRDGWAMASTPQATIGIWAGRPDGTASPGLTGRDTAAPLLADVLSLLHPDTAPETTPMSAHHAGAILSPALQTLSRGKMPQIIFPHDHADIESRSPDGGMLPIGLEASGGQPPYRWFVNGMPLTLPPGAQPFWTPDGTGFVHIALADAGNGHAAVDIRVR